MGLFNSRTLQDLNCNGMSHSALTGKKAQLYFSDGSCIH